MKTAVLFPGIGYTCDKPLLYYAGKLAASCGYRVLPLSYGGFPSNVRGDLEKMKLCLDMARQQAAEQLSEVDWSACEDILFISKSVGTLTAALYAGEHRIPARHLLLTPLKETIDFLPADAEAAVFHGTADPWQKTEPLTAVCAARGIVPHLTPGANHSLETGDLETDLRTLAETVRTAREFILTGPASPAEANS